MPAGKPRDYYGEWCLLENSKWKTGIDVVFAVKSGFSAHVVSTEIILKNFWSLHKANFLHFCGQCSTAVLWCADLGSGLGHCGFHLPFGDIAVCFLGQLCPGASLPCCRMTGCEDPASLQLSVLILLAGFVCWVPVQVSCSTMSHRCACACWLWCLRSSLAALARACCGFCCQGKRVDTA